MASTSKPELSSRAYGYKPQVFENGHYITKKKVLSKKKNKRPLEENPAHEQNPELACEPGRRPARRAAVVAAKKIYNAVRNYEVRQHDETALQTDEASPSATNSQQKIKKKHSHMTLELLCEEEVLSSIQTKIQRAAADAYNNHIKYMIELEKQGYKIIDQY